jgi:serine protease
MKALGVGAVAGAMFVASAAAGASSAMAASPSQPPTGIDPVPLSELSREVVVVSQSPSGPEVSTVQAATQPAADQLTRTLNQIPGTVADENVALRLPTDVTAQSTVSATSVSRGGRRYQLTTVPTAAGETFAGRQWGLGVIGAEKAWRITQGKGVVIAVVDSGVDADHPDLHNRLLPQIDVVADGETGDVAGHGTHVTGIIAAELNQAGTVGVANQVSILPVRILNAHGWADAATAAAGVIAAAKAGADVINLSVGSSSPSRPLAKAINYAQAQGAVVVAAAGNEGLSGNPVEYPAAYQDVVAVSSMEANGRVSSFANSGRYVDLIAPGARIFSTLPGGLYGYESGTSMAAPHVSAVAALVSAANPSLSAAQIDEVMFGTAVDDLSGNGRDTAGGYGLVQADAAVRSAARQPGGIIGPRATSRLSVGALSASDTSVPAGTKVTLSARTRTLFSDKSWRRTAVGTPIQVQVRPPAGHGWTTVATATVHHKGVARVAVTLAESGSYRLKIGPTSGRGGLTDPIAVTVRPAR